LFFKIVCIRHAAIVFMRLAAPVFALAGPVDFSLFVESSSDQRRNFAVSSTTMIISFA
jgi:hypothetical protein